MIAAGVQAFRQPCQALTFDRTLERGGGAALGLQALAAARSHGWVMPANDSRPAWPKIARSRGPGLLAAGIDQSPADLAGHRGQQVPRRHCRERAQARMPRSSWPAGGARVADCPQGHVGDLRSVPGALLDPEQHLGHHQRRQSPQAHPAALGDTPARSAASAAPLPGAGRDRLPPPNVMGGAVAVLAFCPPGARGHVDGRRTRCTRVQESCWHRGVRRSRGAFNSPGRC